MYMLVYLPYMYMQVMRFFSKPDFKNEEIYYIDYPRNGLFDNVI